MKAIRVHQAGPPDVMLLEEIPDPVPGAGQVVVRAAYAGVNPVDAYVRAGKYPVAAPFPYTPGADAAGTIESIGPDVSGLNAGDRVYTAGTLSGAYAEKVLCRAEQVHPLPARSTFEEGAALGVPYATAWRALFMRARAKPGETLLVHGASGGVGVAAVQIARAAGLRIVGSAGSAAGLELVKRQGADLAVNHHEPDYLKQVHDFAGGRGINVILEMLANENLNKDLGLLSARGRVVVVGSRGPVEIDARQTMGRDSAILGMSLFNATPDELYTIHAAIFAGLSNASLRPVIGKNFKLSDAPQAHQAVSGARANGKILLDMDAGL